MARVKATARPRDGRRFRTGLKPRGHELEGYGSAAAYAASLSTMTRFTLRQATRYLSMTKPLNNYAHSETRT